MEKHGRKYNKQPNRNKQRLSDTGVWKARNQTPLLQMLSFKQLMSEVVPAVDCIKHVAIPLKSNKQT